MKIKIAIVALFMVGMFACTQRTCPTYTKDNIKKVEKTEKDA
jgi:hypothetical protein